MFWEFFEEQFILFVALAIVVGMLLYSYLGDSISGFKSVGADEAVRVYNRDAWVLDVRTEAEYKMGFIGEADNISSTELRSKLASIADKKDEPVLVYCQSGARSSNAARMLVKEGFKDVYNLSGGIMTWKNAGLPMNTPRSLRKQKQANKKK